METMKAFVANVDTQLALTQTSKATGTMAGSLESNEMCMAVFV